MSAAGSQPTLDEDDAIGADGAVAISATAHGPADVRDTPRVKSLVADEDEPEEDPWIGRLLSNVYRVEAKIGEGGMGSVYLAHHIHLQKSFAIKVLVDTIATKSSAVERLRQEAMAAARIDHENIVEVVNFDRAEGGAVYIVMELLKGEALADAIGRGPIELHRALPIAFQICDALHAAHEHHIVHRDLKPENVFLTEKRGRTLVKVLDFGISKIKTAEAEQVRMTKTGQLVGTPLYMSPEQARGESEVDRRVDVYALGVILFEMLAGTPPFDGRNYFELLWKHGNEPPPRIKDINPNVYVPDAVEDVVAKALSKDRDQRFQTMAQFEAALAGAAPEVPTMPAMPSLPPERSSKASPASGATRLAHARTEAAVDAGDGAGAGGGTAAGTETLTLPAGPRWPILAGAVGAAFLVGAALFATFGPSGAEPDADAPDEAPLGGGVTPEATDPPSEREPAASGEPAAVDPPVGVDPPPAPTRVSLTLDSQPAGASVRIGDRTIGTTPLVESFEDGEPVELVFSLPEHLDRTIAVIPSEGLEVPTVRLQRRRRGSTDPGSGSALPIKTGL